MDQVHERGSMDPVHESSPWTRSKVGVHGPLVHVLSSPSDEAFQLITLKPVTFGVCSFHSAQERLFPLMISVFNQKLQKPKS